jgi:uncharacterized surface protein with fasciclin (FAS1) repeats
MTADTSKHVLPSGWVRGTPPEATVGGAMVNDAKVVAADVAADNGVIHAIDTVLMPK